MRLTTPAGLCRRFGLTPFRVLKILGAGRVRRRWIAGRPLILDTEFQTACEQDRPAVGATKKPPTVSSRWGLYAGHPIWRGMPPGPESHQL